ncbi:MAG: hypothetical protein ABSA44_12665 [Bacteroidota bacterium]|jgi:hypothetical protein
MKTLAFALLFIIPVIATGHLKRICAVQYETNDGWSRPVKVEVEFYTGKELNKTEPAAEIIEEPSQDNNAEDEKNLGRTIGILLGHALTGGNSERTGIIVSPSTKRTTTGIMKYDDNSSYACIWFSQNQVAVLKISTFHYVGDVFNDTDFKSIFILTDTTCKEIDSDRQWKLTAKEFGKWIDPRIE